MVTLTGSELAKDQITVAVADIDPGHESETGMASMRARTGTGPAGMRVTGDMTGRTGILADEGRECMVDPVHAGPVCAAHVICLWGCNGQVHSE